MSPSYDLIVHGGRCVTPNGPEMLDIGVRDGVVVALGDLARAAAARRIDATGLTVLPGVIDSQVHFREPGPVHKEDLATGTAAAALGGVTAIFEMPNTKPPTTTPAALEEKLKRARGRAWVDHAFFIGASDDNAEKLGELERLPGCCGVKVFMGSSTGTLLVPDDELLARVLRHTRRRVAIHAEDEERLTERKSLLSDQSVATLHPVWRDEETALFATQRVLRLARKLGRRVHVLHVTTAQELELLPQYRDVATVELTPQHLTLAAPECYERLGNYARMNPPIREAHHRAALWRAIASGVADVIGSDHAPHTREEKDRPYHKAPSGMPGVQTLLPLLLDHMHHGRLTLSRLVDLTSAGPARIYNIIGKGRIAMGYDADFTLVDLGRRETIRDEQQASRCGWTPFHGQTVQGWPVGTIIRGHQVMRDGDLLDTPIGAPVRFQETLQPAG